MERKGAAKLVRLPTFDAFRERQTAKNYTYQLSSRPGNLRHDKRGNSALKASWETNCIQAKLFHIVEENGFQGQSRENDQGIQNEYELSTSPIASGLVVPLVVQLPIWPPHVVTIGIQY